MSVDAVIILGKGVRVDDTLPLIVQHELDYVLSLSAQHSPRLIIVSGRHWGLEMETDKVSEAVAMAQYLKAHARGDITIELEDQSLDTIGNLVFSKQILDVYQEKHILVVSTVAHLSRVQYIVSQLFDASYQFSYYGHQHAYTALDYIHTLCYELCSKLYAHWFFWKFRQQASGDIVTYLEQHHFVYRHGLMRAVLMWLVQRPVHR